MGFLLLLKSVVMTMTLAQSNTSNLEHAEVVLLNEDPCNLLLIFDAARWLAHLMHMPTECVPRSTLLSEAGGG